uniref:PPM-type phosphatase domain-containing protein n=1 Tax=Angiostrongylus cantonensis TaxID=6313 RepID=A0A0K0DRN2_ANGCA
MDDAYAEVILKNNRRMGEEQWKQHIFDEFKAALFAEDLKLSVRPMLGVIMCRGDGYMVYSGAPGRYVQHSLKDNIHKMSCWTRIKQADSCRRIQPVFAVEKDLTSLEESVAIDDGDFTRMVSKVEWTPQLPPLTASYGTGQVLQAMLDNGSKPSPEDVNCEMAEYVVEKVIKKCLNSTTATRRPVCKKYHSAERHQRKTEEFKRWTLEPGLINLVFHLSICSISLFVLSKVFISSYA